MSAILGYVLAASVACSGTTGARLYKTNEIRGGSAAKQSAVLLLTVLYGVTGFAAMFYFSWAVLDWKQLAAFFICHMTLGSWVANRESTSLVWTVFVISVILAVIIEAIFLLYLLS